MNSIFINQWSSRDPNPLPGHGIVIEINKNINRFILLVIFVGLSNRFPKKRLVNKQGNLKKPGPRSSKVPRFAPEKARVILNSKPLLLMYSARYNIAPETLALQLRAMLTH